MSRAVRAAVSRWLTSAASAGVGMRSISFKLTLPTAVSARSATHHQRVEFSRSNQSPGVAGAINGIVVGGLPTVSFQGVAADLWKTKSPPQK